MEFITFYTNEEKHISGQGVLLNELFDNTTGKKTLLVYYDRWVYHINPDTMIIEKEIVVD